MKILIIDDENGIRLALKDILNDEGYEVDLAEDGKAGLDKALAGKYDVIYSYQGPDVQVRQTRCYQHRACGSVARLAC